MPVAGGMQQALAEQQSEALREKIANRKAAIDAADGVLGQFGAAIKETVTDPALMTDTVASNLATMIPGMGVGRAVMGARMAKAATAAGGSEQTCCRKSFTGRTIRRSCNASPLHRPPRSCKIRPHCQRKLGILGKISGWFAQSLALQNSASRR